MDVLKNKVMDKDRHTELVLLRTLEPEQWASIFFSNKDIDKKYLISLAKNIGEHFGIGFDIAVKEKIKEKFEEEPNGIILEEFDCWEYGFHLWDTENIDWSLDDSDLIELTMTCKICGVKADLTSNTSIIDKEPIF